MSFDIFAMTHWSWLILGLALLVCELLAPFAFFLWLGLSAMVTGAVTYLAPDIGWQGQFLLFSILSVISSVISIVVSRKYLLNDKIESDLPNLNRRGQQYVGRTFTLVDPIENGYGKIIVDDTRWQVSGPSLAAGEQVRVVAMHGSVFEVEPATAAGNG